MTTRVIGALVAVLGLLVVLGGILLGGLGVTTGGWVQRVDCGSYFSPDYREAREKDASLVSRSWTDLLRGEAPRAGTEAQEACDSALAQRRIPVLASLGIGSAIVAVGLGVSAGPTVAAAVSRGRRTPPGHPPAPGSAPEPPGPAPSAQPPRPA